MSKLKWWILYSVTIVLALSLRLYGIDWDQGRHFHPDERFLTMVVTNTTLPTSISEYLDPQISPLNPYNAKFDFYVYGTFPLTLVKAVLAPFGNDTYDKIPYFGRMISALWDVLTLIAIMGIATLLAKKYLFPREQLFKNGIELFTLGAGLMYAISVLPIQNSHFFTVDSPLTALLTISLFCAMKFHYDSDSRFSSFTTVAFLISALCAGLAVATKISAIYYLPLILFFIFFNNPVHQEIKELFKNFLIPSHYVRVITFIVVGYVFLRLGDPRFFATGNFFDFTINPKFLLNIEQLKQFSSPNSGYFPPAIQWFDQPKIIFPFVNLIIFGLGLPLGLLSLFGAGLILKEKSWQIRAIIAWACCFFIYQGVQFAFSMRYFYLLYPILAITASYALIQIIRYIYSTFGKTSAKVVLGLILLVVLFWPMSFMQIYTKPHSRVTANDWILANIPIGSVLAEEHWDDALPVDQNYEVIQMPVFAPDTVEKWVEINSTLDRADYIIFTSNRGYGSIMRQEDMYPQMAGWYRKLFNNELGFTKVYQANSFPGICIFKACFEINDQWSEEAFTVYDHPQVTIFKRIVAKNN